MTTIRDLFTSRMANEKPWAGTSHEGFHGIDLLTRNLSKLLIFSKVFSEEETAEAVERFLQCEITPQGHHPVYIPNKVY